MASDAIGNNSTSLEGQGALKIGVQLRFLRADDKARIKELCQKFFPIEYPERWYNDITRDQKYFALSAVFQGMIVGVIVAEIKSRFVLNKDDQDILPVNYPSETMVAYLLSLGVLDEYRENGIGSLLVDSLLGKLRGKDNSSVKAVYLHVLCSNSNAIQFYEKRDFVQHKLIPNYYFINKQERDGFCYVRYLNGGQPPWSVGDYVKHVTTIFTKFNSCASNTTGGASHSHRPPNSKSPTQSVHSYATSVLYKIPKLLPTSLPKLPSFFTSSTPSNEQPEKHDDRRKISPLNCFTMDDSFASSEPEPGQSLPVEARETRERATSNSLSSCSSNNSQSPMSPNACSSEEEFHDSISSPSQLLSDTEQPDQSHVELSYEETDLKTLEDTNMLKDNSVDIEKSVSGMSNLLGNSLPIKFKSLYSVKKKGSAKISTMMPKTLVKSRVHRIKQHTTVEIDGDGNSGDEEEYWPVNETAVKSVSSKKFSIAKSTSQLAGRLRNINFPSSETYPILDEPLATCSTASGAASKSGKAKASHTFSWAGPKNAWESGS